MAFEATARGSGRFYLYVSNTPIPSDVVDPVAWLRANAAPLQGGHDQEREAMERAAGVLAGTPGVYVYYVHDYVVSVVPSNEIEVVPPPPPPSDPIPTTGAVDILDKIVELAPVSNVQVEGATFEQKLYNFSQRHTDWLLHALIETDVLTGKKRVVATVWKGIVIVWKWAQIRLLAGPKEGA